MNLQGAPLNPPAEASSRVANLRGLFEGFLQTAQEQQRIFQQTAQEQQRMAFVQHERMLERMQHISQNAVERFSNMLKEAFQTVISTPTERGPFSDVSETKWEPVEPILAADVRQLDARPWLSALTLIRPIPLGWTLDGAEVRNTPAVIDRFNRVTGSINHIVGQGVDPSVTFQPRPTSLEDSSTEFFIGNADIYVIPDALVGYSIERHVHQCIAAIELQTSLLGAQADRQAILQLRSINDRRVGLSAFVLLTNVTAGTFYFFQPQGELAKFEVSGQAQLATLYKNAIDGGKSPTTDHFLHNRQVYDQPSSAQPGQNSSSAQEPLEEDIADLEDFFDDMDEVEKNRLFLIKFMQRTGYSATQARSMLDTAFPEWRPVIDGLNPSNKREPINT